jgi:hypothetical protein
MERNHGRRRVAYCFLFSPLRTGRARKKHVGALVAPGSSRSVDRPPKRLGRDASPYRMHNSQTGSDTSRELTRLVHD